MPLDPCGARRHGTRGCLAASDGSSRSLHEKRQGLLDPAIAHDRTALVRQRHNGRFWKPCPGTTRGYLCCGYQILTPLTGCGMYCTYCILQAYFDHSCQVHFENLDDMETEVREGMRGWPGVARFGTGEFADSLYLEDKLGLCRRIAALLRPYPAVVEFKTKSACVSCLKEIAEPGRTVAGFSLNAPRVIERYERDTASLERRLDAARECIDMGMWVAVHFDPILHYPQWECDYREVVDLVFAKIKYPERIAWWSLGALRAVPRLKAVLRNQNRHLPLFSGELVLGEDRKLRYFRPIRGEMYRAVSGQILKNDPCATVYLCMESPEVWRDAGLAERISGGLARYLDARAERMLGMPAA